MAYVLGSAGLGAGGVAVFITHVEAGPVALLAVGLIFMIVALSGRLPTRLRVGDNEAEWQEVAGNIIETAVDASPPSVKAELAPQLSELAEVAPRAAVRNQLRGQAVVSARRGVQGCPARASRMACMGGTALSLMVIR